MSEEAFAKFKDDYIGILADIYSGNDSMLSALSDTTGKSVDEMGSYLDATQGYIDSLSGVGESLKPLAESIGNVDESIGILSSTASEADENLSGAADSVDNVNSSLGETASATSEVASNVGNVVDGLNQMPESGKISGLGKEFDTLADSIGKVAKALGIGEDNAVGTLFQAMSNLNTVTLGGESEGIIGQFALLKQAITDVIDTIGLSEEQAVGSIMGAITQLNSITLDESIIKQFTNLKTAIDSVTSAISGGGGGESSGGEGEGGSGSSKSGESGGKSSKGKGESSGGNSLTGAIESMGDTAAEVIGEPDAEGDGTVIGEFGSMETAVNDVRDAIGTEGSEGQGGNSGGESDDTLVGSIEYLGDKTEEEMGESGGDGIIGRFEEFRDVIGSADEHVKSISDGLDEIDGKTVECTIKVNIETSGSTSFTGASHVLGSMNLNSADYNAKYLRNAHVEGTALASGNWAVQSNEYNALVGEEGFEIISRNGRFFTVGDNGAEMTNIKRGDIVFNHDQSVQLLKYGHISGRGKAYADGTVGGGKVLTPDGKILRPLQPGDKGYDLMKAFEPLVQKMLNGEAEIISNAVFDGQKQMEKWTKEITNNTAINNVVNNNKNIQQPIHNEIHVTLPNVTNSTSAESLLRDLESINTKKYQVNW